MMKHSGVAITLLTYLRILVLMKSIPEDDFDLMLLIAFFTSSSVTSVKEKFRFLPFNFSYNLLVGSMLCTGILLSILLTFSGKNLLKISATSSSFSIGFVLILCFRQCICVVFHAL